MKATDVLLAGALVASSCCALAAPVVLFDGSSLPSTQGWLTRSGVGSTPGNIAVSIADGVYMSSTTGSAFNHHGIETLSGEFIVVMRASVQGSSHNYADAGFFFSPIGYSRPDLGSPPYIQPDREYSIYIDPTGIGFWDDQGGTYSIDTAVRRDYGIKYEKDRIEVFVDATVEDIVNNTISPVLQRNIPAEHFFAYDAESSVPSFQRYFEGVLSFGDWTNDPGVNSNYQVDEITFAQLSPRLARPPVILPTDPGIVPEPSTVQLALSALLALLVAARKRLSVL